MRRLVHVPILHTAADLGSLAEAVRARYAELLGPTAWSQRQRALEGLWAGIRGRIEALQLDYPKTKIYQDGLPVCGFEQQIVQELAQAGSANHQLVLDLLERGAMLVGTEDPQLLVEEYQLHRQQTPAPAGAAEGDRAAADQARRLLEARDRFIARRIDETLAAGETGLLFLGAGHRLEGLPAADIRVETL